MYKFKTELCHLEMWLWMGGICRDTEFSVKYWKLCVTKLDNPCRSVARGCHAPPPLALPT